MIPGLSAAVLSRGFLPTHIAGCKLWLRADRGLWQDAARTTPATADGDPIGAWEDLSGNGNHATQSTAAAKPTLKLGVMNGQPVIRFDGVDDWLATGNLSLTSFTIILVFKASAPTSIVYEHSPNVNTNDGNYMLATTAATVAVKRSGLMSAKNLSVNWGNDNIMRIARQNYEGTHASHTLSLNGTVQTLTDHTVNNPGTIAANTPLYLGARGGVSNYATCDFAEMIVYSPALSAEEKRNERYCGSRYAITVS